MIEIRSNNVRLLVNELGAELEALYFNDINVLWTGDKSLWSSKAPILFPIVGGLKDNYYLYNNEKYTLEPHGFVKGLVFNVDYVDETSVTLSHIYNEETLKHYPFKYKLVVKYSVQFNRVLIEFDVHNLDDKEIYYSIGFHPGFSYIGLKELVGNNVVLSNNSDKTTEVVFSPSYVLGFKERNLNDLALNELTDELIVKRTICYKTGFNVSLKDINKLVFNTNMEYYAYWQKGPEDNPKFICVESWDGLPDCDDTNHCIENKLGIKKLNINSTHNTNFEIKLEKE